MKLCLIAPAPPPLGGVANWEEILVNEIRKHNDISLTFINIAINKRPTDGRSILDRIFYSGYLMVRAYIELRGIVKREIPDVVHMATSGGLGFIRDILLLKYLKKKHIPSVYHIHFGRSEKYKEQGKWCWKQLTKAVSIADTTITIDRKSQGILKLYANEIYNINNPIDVKLFDKYRRSDSEKIVYIGSIIKAKGIEELLEAFLAFNKARDYKYVLELIGPGDKEYLSKLKREHDFLRVELVGEVSHDEAMKRLAKANLFILPSYTEGFPNAILEAMALAKCIVATRVGAIPEMLEGGAGTLISPRSPDAIFHAFNCLCDDKAKREQYGLRAYNRVSELYDINTTYLRYREIWAGCKERFQ